MNTNAHIDLSWASKDFSKREMKTTLGNFQVAAFRRKVDGYLITAKNSGTHWVQFMLSHALAAHYNKPPPSHSTGKNARDFILAAKSPVTYPDIPKIYQSHAIPSAILALNFMQAISPSPPTVVLVRDIRQALLSHFVKWREKHSVTQHEYILGSPQGKRFNADIWWYVLFFNRWGEMAKRYPDRVTHVRYEDVIKDPGQTVKQIASRWGIELDDNCVAAAEAVSGREVVASLQDPAYKETIVPVQEIRDKATLSDEDNEFIDAVFARYLRHDFGYGYPTAPYRAR